MEKTIKINEEEIKNLILSRWANLDFVNFGFCVDFGARTKEFFILEENPNLKLKEIIFKYEDK